MKIIDGLRAAAILEEGLEKLAFLSVVEPDVFAHKDELAQAVGDEVQRTVE